MGREESVSVVAPAALPRERVHRHELHVRHTELPEMVELLPRSVERPLRCKGPDVELVHKTASKGWRLPACVLPGVLRVIEALAGRVYTVRESRGARIGQRQAFVEPERVIASGYQPRCVSFVEATTYRLKN